MKDTTAIDAMFGDDYIPLATLVEDWVPQAGLNATNQTRKCQVLPRLEHILSRPVKEAPNDVREKTLPPSHIAAVLPTFEMDVQMSDVGREMQMILNASALPSSSQYVQTANRAGHQNGDGPQSSDLIIPSPTGSLVPSAHAEEGEVSSVNTLSASFLSQTKGVDMAACDVGSLARNDTHPLSIQPLNESDLSRLSSTNPVHSLQQHTLVVADIAKSKDMETKGQIWESSLQKQSSHPVATSRIEDHLSKSLTGVPKQPFNKDTGEVYRSNSSCLLLRVSNNENVRRPNDSHLGAVLHGDQKLALPELPITSASKQHNKRQHPPFELAARGHSSRTDAVPCPKTFQSQSVPQYGITTKASGTHLPFKLQHDLLTTIQVLIEETCFYFAQKWLPRLLKQKGWDTPEQGELTSWWLMFSNQAVPSHAISFRGCEAKDLFRRCRQIRNTAVHRNYVSIPGIGLMLQDTLALIGGLNDELRLAKVRKLQHCFQPRNLDALRMCIDEPLGEFRTFQNPPPVGGAGGQVGFMRHDGGRTNASERPLGTFNSLNAFQFGPPSTLSSAQIVGVLGTKSTNVSLLPTLRASEGPKANLSNTGLAKIIGPQSQADKYREYKLDGETQPDLGDRLIQPPTGLDICAQSQGNMATATTGRVGMEGFRTELPSNAPSIKQPAQDSHIVAMSNDDTLRHHGFEEVPVIDLTGDTIIDLTQESDNEIMVESGLGFSFPRQEPAVASDPFVASGQAVANGQVVAISNGQVVARRVMEPKGQRAEKLRMRRERKLLAEQSCQAAGIEGPRARKIRMRKERKLKESLEEQSCQAAEIEGPKARKIRMRKERRLKQLLAERSSQAARTEGKKGEAASTNKD